MLNLAAPAWLLGGLLLAPLIRRLHRLGPQLTEWPVARLDLWPQSAAASPALGVRSTVDPAWRRRAVLALLLCAALAGPQWTAQPLRITLWIDDSPSMLTNEIDGTRMALGLAEVRSQLASLGSGLTPDVQVRRLGDPWRALGSISELGSSLPAAGSEDRRASTSAAPPAELLRADRLHWLLTDGAHPAVLAWPAGRRPERVIQVGRVARNVGIQRFAARRDPDDPGSLALLLSIVNGGSVAETRELVVSAGATEMQRSTQRLAPGESVIVELRSPQAPSLHAELRPGDALAEDDRADLDLAPLRRLRVAAGNGCPRALLAAVRAHPALSLAAAAAPDAELALVCGSRPGVQRVPTLSVLTGATASAAIDAARPPLAAGAHRPGTSPTPPTLQWDATVPAARRAGMADGPLPLAARLPPGPLDRVLLAADGEPAIVWRAGAQPWIETAIDFDALADARGPQIPLLVNLLFEQLLGRDLLDPLVIEDRGRGACQVAPLVHPAAVAVEGPGAHRLDPAPVRRDLSPPLLIVGLGILGWELLAFVRRWPRTPAARASLAGG